MSCFMQFPCQLAKNMFPDLQLKLEMAKTTAFDFSCKQKKGTAGPLNLRRLGAFGPGVVSDATNRRRYSRNTQSKLLETSMEGVSMPLGLVSSMWDSAA